MSVVVVLLLSAGGWLFGLPTGDVCGSGTVSRGLELLVEVGACRVSAPNGSFTSSSSAMLVVSCVTSARTRMSTGRKAGGSADCVRKDGARCREETEDASG